MEDNLMEKILNDFNGVLSEFNQLVQNKDKDGILKFFNEVNRLLHEENNIVLDEREPQYDHVLHELLDKMNGVVGKETIINSNPELRKLKEEKEQLVDEKNILESEISKLEIDSEEVVTEQVETERVPVEKIRTIIESVDVNSENGEAVNNFLEELLSKAVHGYVSIDDVNEAKNTLENELKTLNDNTQEIDEEPLSEEEIAAIDEENKELQDLVNEYKEQLKVIVDQVNDISSDRIEELKQQLREVNLKGDDLKLQSKELKKQLKVAEKSIRDFVADDPEQVVTESTNVLDPNDYTYMGRLSNEQIIRRLLSEEVHLSDEEIESTLSEYSLVQVNDGVHDENGEDNPIPFRQLVRTTTTSRETLEQKRDKIQAKLDSLKEEKVEINAQKRKINSQIRTAQKEEISLQLEKKNKEIEELTNSLEINDNTDIDAEIESLKAEMAGYIDEHEVFDILNKENILDRETRISSLERKISMYERYLILKNETSDLTILKNTFGRKNSKKVELNSKIAQVNEKIKDNNERKNRAVKLNDRVNSENVDLNQITRTLEITAIISELENISLEKETYVDTVRTTTRVTDEEQKEIDSKKSRISEINARIAEIDDEFEKVNPVVNIEGLDVTSEARKLGDNIFKTAKIRRELAEREVSREEFLEFYQRGNEINKEKMNLLNKEYETVTKEIQMVIVPVNGEKRISVEIDEAEKASNQERLKELYERLRQRFIDVGREDQLKDCGLDHEISSEEDIRKMETIFKQYKDNSNQVLKNIKDEYAELKENSKIFSEEIDKIRDEQTTFEIAGDSIENLEKLTEMRLDIRRKLLEASITPESELTEEQEELLELWQNTSERFLSNKSIKDFVYVDADGVKRTIGVDTIEEYPKYQKDAEFLGVPDYKEYLEQVSAWNQTNDPYVFGEKIGKEFYAAEAQREGAGQEIIESVMSEKQKYVETFNGIPNPHKVKYENWKTAGSTLKGMKPVSRDLPIPARAKNALENVGRFLGIRVPKFTRIDEHGNEVRDIKSGVTTLALDGLVAGAVIGSALTIGPALAIAGYAAKGIVTIGNRVAANIEYSKHKDEIDGNIPVLNQANADSREVARKAYYRKKGDNKLVAWFKAKSDKYITRVREKETEMAIVDDLFEGFEKTERARADVLKTNIELANKNQETRQARQRQVAMSSNTYNDIVRDPDSVDMDQATETIARNAAVASNKPDARVEDVNASSKEERKAQYFKNETSVERTEDLDNSAFDAPKDTPISAITEEQIYTGRKQNVDRMNRVLTAITTIGIKAGIEAWKNGLSTEEAIHHEEVTQDRVVHHDAVYETKEVNVTEQQFDTSITLDELRKNYAGKEVDKYYSVSGGQSGQFKEALADDGVTAIWYDNGTKWGTGIADAHGLTAPNITEKLADAALLDSNGMLRQDISVQQLLDAVGYDKNNLSSLEGLYVSVGDKHWAELADLMQGKVKDVITGVKTDTVLVQEAYDEVVKDVIKNAYDETITNVSSGSVVDALKEGTIVGAGVAAADTLHEAAQTTYINNATPGRPEEVTSNALTPFDRLEIMLYETALKEKRINDEYNNDHDENDDEYEYYDEDER